MIDFHIGEKLKASLLPRPVSSMLEWAEANIVIPDGPHKGEPFDANTQPFARLFFQEVDSARWERIVATGPTQTGKSLICYIIPVLYHLFAIAETVVAGLPTIDMADDKWNEDFRPVIEASPELRKLLPAIGLGSRAGRVKARVKFRNGATLRFLSGGGGDKSRAGFTGRILAVTEVDGLAGSAKGSKEADKLKQMEGRQRAFLQAGTRTYLECTVTTAAGRIWTEYTNGTESRIVRPCPKCKAWVTPEREHLTGWQQAQDELEARANAAWTCPVCAATWTEQERHQANRAAVVAHRGQEVTPDGRVVGPTPPTRTLSFRWTAADNHFASAADVAADEWNGQREQDRENAEKELRQFVFCIPYDPPEVSLMPLDVETLAKRQAGLRKGICPAGCLGVTVGIDTGRKKLHWVAVAMLPTGGGRIIEYGIQQTDADTLGTTAGLVDALGKLKAYFAQGWPDENGQRVHALQVWIDSGWHEHTGGVYQFCLEANRGTRFGSERYRPSKGYGEGQRRMERYWMPKRTDSEVRYIGPGYHLAAVPRAGCLLAHVSADAWKSQLHERLNMPPDSPQAVLLYDAPDATEHREFSEHLTAERQVSTWSEGRVEVVQWERTRRQNHFLDASYAALAAGDLLLALTAKASPRRKTLQEMADETRRGAFTRNGRPWLATER